MAVALWLGLASATAQAAEAQSCLTESEAKSFIVALLPDVTEGLSRKCESVLPESAMLRAGLPSMRDRYRAAADQAWPEAVTVFSKMGGKEKQQPNVDPKLLRPMMSAMIVDGITADIKPEQCTHFDHLFTALAPLPPGNIADMFVAVLQLSGKGDKSFAICPAAAPATSATARP
jgi:hypothetical protein